MISRRNLLKTSLTASAAAIVAPAIISRSAFAADPILVGSLHDQSGTLAASGVPMVDSLELAVKEINDAGGLIGRPLKLITYDTQSNIQQYSQYAQQISVRDKVAVVFGGITSASMSAIRPTFNRFRIPYFYNTFYEGGVCDRNTFCTGTTPAQTTQKLVQYAMGKSGKKAYIVAADYNYGQITAKWMRKYVQDNGGEVLGADFFPLDVTNFGSTISKIQAAKPDLVLSVLVGANHSAFYRQWTSAGLKDQIPIASTTFGAVNELATMDAAESEGIYASFGFFDELTTPAGSTFVEHLKKDYPGIPYIGELGAATYEGVHLWAEAVRKAGAIEQMPVIEALESGISFDGPSGKVTIDHATHHTTRSAYVGQVKNRQWSVVESYPDNPPLDTAGVCDLIKNPRDSKQYVIDI